MIAQFLFNIFCFVLLKRFLSVAYSDSITYSSIYIFSDANNAKKYKVPVPYYGDTDDDTSTDYLRKVWYSVVDTHYEFPGYDGWYNNRAHPDWGGAGKICIKLVVQSA